MTEDDELGNFESELAKLDEQQAEDKPMEPENPDGIKIGDVALDLAQGRAVHVIEQYDGTAKEWSDENDYEITENYGNSRLGAEETDAVFEVVYCNNAKSEPSRSYAMPESRLLRIETESADGGKQVYDRITLEVLDRLFQEANKDDENSVLLLEHLAEESGFSDELIGEAKELAEAATFGE